MVIKTKFKQEEINVFKIIDVYDSPRNRLCDKKTINCNNNLKFKLTNQLLHKLHQNLEGTRGSLILQPKE